MSSTEMEKYSQGYVFSQQAELDSLENPENYMDDINTAKRINQQNIESYERISREPLASNRREAWARRNQAKKAVREAKKRTKQIDAAEKDLRKQIEKRKAQLEEVKIKEQASYIVQVKEQEQKRKELEAKQQWLMTHKIGDIPKGIELGYLHESQMKWFSQKQQLENRPGRKYPTREVNKLEFLYKGGTEKEWGSIIKHQDTQRAASQRQSASIKGAAAIVDSGGVLGGKYTGTGYDEGTGQLTGDGSANNWGGYGSKEAQQRALQQELAKSFQAHPTYFNKSPITSGFSTGSNYFRDGKMIDPKSDEGKKLQQVLTTQTITKDVNEKQRKLFSDITKADSALEAWNIRSKAMTDDPRVGTFNYLLQDGKVTETSGTIGIATKTEYTREKGGLNKDSPLVFKSEYDPSVVPVDPGFKGIVDTGFKGIVDTTPQELSFVGYSPEGKPLQGPPEPEFITYEIPEFLTLQDFARDYHFKENPLTSGTEKLLADIENKIISTNPKDPDLSIPGDAERWSTEKIITSRQLMGLGVIKEAVSVGASIMNLATQHVNPFFRDWENPFPRGHDLKGLVSSYNYKTGQWELPKDERPIQIPETALGKGIEDTFTGGNILQGQAEYFKTHGDAAFGEYLTLYPGTGAAKPILKLTGTGFKTVTAPIQATVKTPTGKTDMFLLDQFAPGAPTSQAVPVAESLTIFGKPIITKTLKQPDIFTITKGTGATPGKGVYFVGVTSSRADDILKKGFTTEKAGEQTYQHLLEATGSEGYAAKRAAEISPKGTIFFTPNPQRALAFAEDAAKASGGQPVVLRAELKEGTKIKRINTLDPKKEYLAEDIALAKKEGYQGILKRMGDEGSNLELVLFDEKAMKAPSLTRTKGGQILSLANTAGTWKLGKASAEQIMERVKLIPGFSTSGKKADLVAEIMTGTKLQTQFNVDVIKQLVKQGKISKDAVREVELVSKIVERAMKAKPKIFGGFGKKPFMNLRAGLETSTAFESVRRLQKWNSLKEGRLGEVGGSVALDPQLLREYSKGKMGLIGDMDVAGATQSQSKFSTTYWADQMVKAASKSDSYLGIKELTKQREKVQKMLDTAKAREKIIRDNFLNPASSLKTQTVRNRLLKIDKKIDKLTKKIQRIDLRLEVKSEQAVFGKTKIGRNKFSFGDKGELIVTEGKKSFEAPKKIQQSGQDVLKIEGKDVLLEGDFYRTGGGKTGYKVGRIVQGKKEIVFEVLTQKDALKGNLEAQQSGMRFGYKYRADTLFGFARKRIVEPETGITIQDLRDGLLNKAASIMTLQRRDVMPKFSGDKADDILNTLEKSDYLYEIAPPAQRSKDIVDFYKITKTQASKLDDEELGGWVEEYRALKESQYKKIDFTMPSKASIEINVPSSNTFSSAVSSAGSQTVQLIKPSVLPGIKLTSPKQDQMLSSSTTSKVKSPSVISKSPSITSAISKSVIKPPAVMSATISSATRSATSKIGSLSARSSTSLTSKTSRTSATSPASPTSPSLTSVTSPTSPTSFTGFTLRLSPGRSSGLMTTSTPTSGTGRQVKGGMSIINWGATRTEEPKPTKKKPLKDFIGNVSESSILGVYKRKELTYGKKRVLKLSAKDKKLQASAKNRLQFLKEKDIVKKRKKKSKTQTVLGFSQPKQKKLTKKEKKSKVVRF